MFSTMTNKSKTGVQFSIPKLSLCLFSSTLWYVNFYISIILVTYIIHLEMRHQ